jgi:hypothetical protein
MSIATLELLRAIGEFEDLLDARIFLAVGDEVESDSAKVPYLPLAILNREN